MKRLIQPITLLPTIMYVYYAILNYIILVFLYFICGKHDFRDCTSCYSTSVCFHNSSPARLAHLFCFNDLILHYTVPEIVYVNRIIKIFIEWEVKIIKILEYANV